jgi:membrane protein YdbS with pleckstrin-like domain
VTVDTSELSKEVGRLTRLGRQIVIAVMLVGLVIGSAVATGVAAYSDETGRVWETLSRVAPVALILALAVSFLIVFRLTWRWMRGKTTDED